MQSSIGKRRSYKGPRRARITTFTCIKRIATGVVLGTLLLSCSHIKKQKPGKPFKGLCLSGDGKGRIEHLDGRYVFSYENLLKAAEQEWLLGLSLPMHGEEVLTLGYGDVENSKVQIKGRFFSRMIYAARKEKKLVEIAQLKKVLSQIGIFLKAVHLVRIGDQPCIKGVCKVGEKHKFSYEENVDELSVNFIFDENHEFKINARSKSSFYRKINFILRDKRRKSDARQPFSLALIHRECSETL